MALAYSDIEALPPDWLWDQRLPGGEVVVVAGPGGGGKGLLMADLIARVTTGSPWPDGSESGKPADVVMVSTEDDPNTSVAWRLRAAGADLGRVHDVDSARFELPRDVAVLRQAIAETGAALAVVDPLAGASSISLASVVSVRNKIMRPLQAIAHETGCTIVLVHHTTKSGEIAGSRAVVDSVRAVLTVQPSADDPDVRVLGVHKSNLSGRVAPLKYKITGEDHESCRVEYVANEGQAPGAGITAIVAVLGDAEDALSAREVAAAAGLPYPSVRVLLRRAAKRGLISQPGRGVYSL